MNKFKNKKIFTTAGKFDSKKEMHRYLELAAMQEAGKITGLERQARYKRMALQNAPYHIQQISATQTKRERLLLRT